MIYKDSNASRGWDVLSYIVTALHDSLTGLTSLNLKGETPGPAPHGKNNLVTIGSAAVLAVYAAGFFRTRVAAQRFADDSEIRHPAEVAVAPSVDAPILQHFDSAPAAPKPKVRAVVVAAAPKAGTWLPLPIDSLAPAVTTPPAVGQPPAPLPVAVAVDTAPTPIEKAVAGYKDGTYRGWGTSRHGDIEAAVDIKDGKIAAAYISQCLTRYSCSWISHLPGQVLARQAADVDYVSGATQSSNAFYHAILEALSKAK